MSKVSPEINDDLQDFRLLLIDCLESRDLGDQEVTVAKLFHLFDVRNANSYLHLVGFPLVDA